MVLPADQDPWTRVQTRHGFAADEVISALQKEIRRGQAENAALLAYEMMTTSAELEAKMWQRLLVISVEDIGWGDVQAPNLVYQAAHDPLMASLTVSILALRNRSDAHRASLQEECGDLVRSGLRKPVRVPPFVRG